MKKYSKISKIVLMLFVTLTVMIFGVDAVNAASAPNTLQTGTSSYAGNYIGGIRFETKTLSSGGYAYCLNIHKTTTANVAIARSKKMDNGFAYIIKNGYPAKSLTGDKKKDYYITQMAVWLYQDETGQNESGYGRNLSASFRTKYVNDEMAKKVIELVDGALNAQKETLNCKGESLSANATDGNLYKSQSGKYYVSKPVTVTSAASYAVSFTSAPTGTFAANAKGEKKTTFSKGETFSVYVPVSSVTTGTTKVSVKINSNYSTKCISSIVYEYKPGNSGVQSVIPAIVYDSEEQEVKEEISLEFSVTVTDTAKIRVIKIDASTGNGLSGAEMELQDANGNVIISWTSSEDYYVIDKNITNGKYYVVEKKAPKGYVLDSTKHEVVLSDTQKEVTVKVYNTRAEERLVNIVKVDKDTNKLLPGAVLVVRDSTGKVVVRFTTSDKPYILSELKDGTYTVEEESAPAGYVKSDEIITVTVDDAHVSQTITFTNVKEATTTNVPNTASSISIISYILGILIIGSGIGYVIYNSKKQKLNK